MIVTNNNAEILEYVSKNESIIKHKKAKCFCCDGSVPIIKGFHGSYRGDIFLNVLTDEPHLSDHIDIMLEKPFIIEYELSDEPISVDHIVFMGFGTGRYDIRKFDVYATVEGDTVSDENLIYRYNCSVETIPGARNTCDVMFEFEKPILATKIAIKISEPNVSDNCMRISFIGVYSEQYSNTIGFLKKLGENLLTPENIDIYDFKSEKLCNSIAYDKDFLQLDNQQVKIHLEKGKQSGTFRVYYKGDGKIHINGKNILPFEISKDNLCCEYYVDNQEVITIQSEGIVFIYELALYESQIEIDVEQDIICQDFHGIGACVLPMSFMDNSLSQGFNKSYWEKEKSRVNLCKPSVVRMWFQPDWFIIDQKTYYNHEYDFNSEKMQAVYPYLDMFKESGIEVELNYGWKVDDRITSWYSIKGVPRPRESAPADLDEFAYSCAEFMHELIVNRGYTNIKYLTFYNEPGARYTYTEHYTGDFHVGPSIHEKVQEDEIPQEKFDYWYEMLSKAKTAISKRGLDNKVKFWGPEYAIDNISRTALWLKGFAKDSPCKLDAFTIHKYNEVDTEIKQIAKTLKNVIDIPLCATEFAVNGKGCTWGISNTQMALSFISGGWSGALLWLLSGTALASPLNFNIDSDNDNMWRYLPAKTEGVNSIFYELCLFMRYIPAHSKVLDVITPKPKLIKMFRAKQKKWVSIEDPTVRATALITPSGDYIVIAETPQSELARTLKINLPIDKDLVFNKISVGKENNLLAPSKLPTCSKTVITRNGTLIDEVDKNYTLTFYTTAKPWPQIVCDNDVYYMHCGENRKINFSIFDCETNLVSFEILVGDNVVSLDDESITVSNTAKPGDMAAIKLKINDVSENSYFVLLVKVL